MMAVYKYKFIYCNTGRPDIKVLNFEEMDLQQRAIDQCDSLSVMFGCPYFTPPFRVPWQSLGIVPSLCSVVSFLIGQEE